MRRLAAVLVALLMVGCKPEMHTMKKRPSWMSEAPKALTEELYQSAASLDDLDTLMWLFLLDLIPGDERPYSVRTAEMLNSVSPELGRYFLTRGFDWERGSGGLEGCLMQDPSDNALLLEKTITAYEQLGACKHAAVIRELIPKAAERWKQIEKADTSGEEFNYDDGFWNPYEEQWDAACKEFDFYEVIWKDIQAHPERYAHSK